MGELELELRISELRRRQGYLIDQRILIIHEVQPSKLKYRSRIRPAEAPAGATFAQLDVKHPSFSCQSGIREKNLVCAEDRRGHRKIEQADCGEGVRRHQGVRPGGVHTSLEIAANLLNERKERRRLRYQDTVCGIQLCLTVVRGGLGDRASDEVVRCSAIGEGRSRGEGRPRPAVKCGILVETIVEDCGPAPHNAELVEIDNSSCRIDRISLCYDGNR